MVQKERAATLKQRIGVVQVQDPAVATYQARAEAMEQQYNHIMAEQGIGLATMARHMDLLNDSLQQSGLLTVKMEKLQLQQREMHIQHENSNRQLGNALKVMQQQNEALIHILQENPDATTSRRSMTSASPTTEEEDWWNPALKEEVALMPLQRKASSSSNRAALMPLQSKAISGSPSKRTHVESQQMHDR